MLCRDQLILKATSGILKFFFLEKSPHGFCPLKANNTPRRCLLVLRQTRQHLVMFQQAANILAAQNEVQRMSATQPAATEWCWLQLVARRHWPPPCRRQCCLQKSKERQQKEQNCLMGAPHTSTIPIANNAKMVNIETTQQIFESLFASRKQTQV